MGADRIHARIDEDLAQKSETTDAQARFVASVSLGAVRIFELAPTHWPRVEALMRKYAALPMDLVDASLVLCAEDLGRGEILSTDEGGFGACRWKNRKPFENLSKRR